MGRKRGIGIFALALLAAEPSFVAAQSVRTTPAIESQFQSALTAIQTDQYIRATQLLTSLVGMPEHVHSQRAQELLGNVREANGQLAHAVAEYRIYLQKYPDGEGAARVNARLSAILSGAQPSQVDPNVVAAAPRQEIRPIPAGQRPSEDRRTFGGGGARAVADSREPSDGDIIESGGMVVKDSGSLRLTYRYNEGETILTELTPDPIPNVEEREDDVFENSLTAGLRYTRTVEDANRKMTFSISGSQEVDFEDDDDEFRLHEAYVSLLSKGSGSEITFGRQRLRPSGIAYRLDGLSFKNPLENGVEIGLFAGMGVESTRDDPFSGDAYLFGLSATYEQLPNDGEISVYLVQEEEDSYTLRQAIGAEYRVNLGSNYLFVNGEYDLQLEELNRVLVTGTRVFENRSRLTARLAHYRSPGLSLDNALIGQDEDTLQELSDAGFTDSEIEQMAVDRAAKVSTFGLTYSTKLNDKWNVSAFGSLYYTSGTPSSFGVAATENGGVRSYAGFQFSGSGVFKEQDQLNLGLRYSHSEDNDYALATASLRYPVSEKLSLRPRVRVGYRDYSDGHQVTIAPSINVRYKLNDQTNLSAEVGRTWRKGESSSLEEERNDTFVTLGLSRRF